MSLVLRAGLHFRQIGEAVIFFDLNADRYFLLAGRSADRFLRCLSGESAASDTFVEQGILVENEGSVAPRPSFPASPDASIEDMSLPAATFSATVACVLAQRRSRRDLKHDRLSDIVREFQSESARGTLDERIYGEVAAAFERAKRYLPAIDQCLVRGIAMKRMLIARGCPASLVFGVTMPFAAHCWVQAENIVLSDPLDIVLHYQPIFFV